MDFFEQQAQAHRKTKWLIVYFAMAVVAMIIAIYVAALLIFSGIKIHESRSEYGQEQPPFSVWDPQIFGTVSLVTLTIIGVGSLYRISALSAGGRAVSEMMGARAVNPTTTDPDERKLLNVVEEMAIASGVPVPQVYVMDEEDGINAFAAGHQPGDATVTVTRGCMKLLSRDELQGVIAHEFSHILNGDMRLNLRLMGLVFGILCLTVIGRVLIRTRGRKNPLPLVGLALIVVGWAGAFFGRLIQAAVSRQRELLADAAAVQFTRNPAGLGGALKKIGGLGYGSRIESPHAEEASHLFLANGVGNSLFSTHPPLTERIRALDPNFEGKFPHVTEESASAIPP